MARRALPAVDPRAPVARPQPVSARPPECAARRLLSRVRLRPVRTLAIERHYQRHCGGCGPALLTCGPLPGRHAAARVHGADTGRPVLRGAHRPPAAARAPPAPRRPQRETRLALAASVAAAVPADASAAADRLSPHAAAYLQWKRASRERTVRPAAAARAARFSGGRRTQRNPLRTLRADSSLVARSSGFRSISRVYCYNYVYSILYAVFRFSGVKTPASIAIYSAVSLESTQCLYCTI